MTDRPTEREWLEGGTEREYLEGLREADRPTDKDVETALAWIEAQHVGVRVDAIKAKRAVVSTVRGLSQRLADTQRERDEWRVEHLKAVERHLERIDRLRTAEERAKRAEQRIDEHHEKLFECGVCGWRAPATSPSVDSRSTIVPFPASPDELKEGFRQLLERAYSAGGYMAVEDMWAFVEHESRRLVIEHQADNRHTFPGAES